ncbi:MAG: GNAT family N-acetyltransferase [Polyangiaceae bacterium]
MSEQESSLGSGSEGSSSTANPLGLVLEAAQPKHGAALVSLFERTSTPCHCQYWHFTGDKNAWLDRLFHAPELNRAAFLENLAQPGLKGIVALRGEQAVGWMKLCLAESLPKLYAQRLYKGLPCFTGQRDGILTVGCLLVDEDERRQGVARALVRHGVRVAEQTGARAVEAFPRRSDQAGPAELWTGPSNIFLEAGFEIINDFAPYPVLRHTLGAART